ncbi:MAG: selenocysteine-specific translation elongation factor, partial [Candidatus Cloacimonetes bacterium]|nr:selenocysteine-specific translation elongation factor [Candidatus Cloacimonadota bacterium]
MKHLIMGTAGHIDHGKTALIKALTNIDCDTHKEEKLRGITINLGFAHIDLPNDESIGIIDVPGHRNFVNTMVAGVSSIDFVMLVIAADSGVMPQTVEHLKIMEILGVKKGFVVLTKIDLVDEEIIQIAEEEILEFIKGTFLENFPIIKVSVKTGEGISELKEFLSEMSYKVEERQRGKLFRMFIDRIFSVKGFGTIVNGSVISGHLEKKDSVYLLPGAKKLRIRRMERHGNKVEEITAGDRASLNLVGLNRDDFKRGMIVSDRILQPTKLIDAKLNLFQHNRNFEIWTQAVFLLGTYQAQTRIHLIDRNILEPGQAAIVQIHLDPPCIAKYGDRFVIR